MEIRIESLSAVVSLYDDHRRASHVIAVALERLATPLLRASGISNKHIISLLASADLTLPPGSSCIVLGGKGSGKSTLLRACCGLHLHAKTSGSIRWDGVDISSLQKRGVRPEMLAHYMNEGTDNEPMLTVRETMQFAFDMAGPHASISAATDAADQLRDTGTPPSSNSSHTGESAHGPITLDELLHVLQLDELADTRVFKLSKQEQRVLSIGEAALSGGRRGKLLCLDQVTKDLSPARAHGILVRLTGYCRARGITLMVTAHEPLAAVCTLFSHVVLLSAGHVIYAGPTGGVLPYLRETCLLEVPHALDPGLFLQAFASDPLGTITRYAPLVSTRGGLAQYSAAALGVAWSLRAAALTAAAPPRQVGASSKLAHAGAGIDSNGSDGNSSSSGGGVTIEPAWMNNPLYRVGLGKTWVEQMAHLLPRSAKIVWRQPAFIAPVVLLGLFFGLTLGTFFFSTPIINPGPRVIVSMLLGLALFIGLVPVATLGAHSASIVTRHIHLGWYGARAYVASYVFCRIPLIILLTAVPVLPLYW